MTTGYQEYHHQKPFPVKYNDGLLPEMTVAYETFGTLNENKSNAVVIYGGLSPSSHVRSHEVMADEEDDEEMSCQENHF